MVGTLNHAFAQAVDCNRLQQQIATLPSASDPSAAARYRASIQTQQIELDRSVAQSRAMGCGRRQILIFGDAPPPQCGPLDTRIQRLQLGLDQLQGQLDRADQGNDAQRRDLMARYQSACVNRAAAPAQSKNLFDVLFGNNTTPRGSLDNNRDNLPAEGEIAIGNSGNTPGTTKAVCVRTCDGGFFPVSYNASPDKADRLTELCHAQCPNTETIVFFNSDGAEIDKATGVDGRPYTTLANAGRFKTKFDATCTCKRPEQSWVDALSNAERLMSTDGRSDLIVSPERAAEMSKPKALAPAKTQKGKTVPEKPAALSADITGAEPVPVVPEAGGPAIGSIPRAKVIGTDQGTMQDEVDGEGVKRRVRIIAPTL